jgi:hypothetical protein
MMFMKQLLCLLFICNAISCFAQYDDDTTPVIKHYDTNYNYREFPILKDSIKQPGIYRTFEEFRNNNPSEKLAGVIVGVDNKYRTSIFTDAYFFKSYKIDLSKEAARELGDVFGFCDGHKIYVLSRAESSARINNAIFYEVNYLGRYCVFDAINFTTYMNSMPGMPGMMSTLPEKGINIIEMTTGESKILTNSRLKKIISDNKVLLARFKQEEDKGEHLKEYLLDYLKGKEN